MDVRQFKVCGRQMHSNSGGSTGSRAVPPGECGTPHRARGAFPENESRGGGLTETLEHLEAQVRECRICSVRFAETASAHQPRPVFWCKSTARLLAAGQAPGARVHSSGLFFDDASGDRLRDWMGVDRPTFYDRSCIAILPMAFCFPGYNSGGQDLPPPAVCARTWRRRILARLPKIRTVLLIGRHAQVWHLGDRAGSGVRELVDDWRSHAPECFPLPHPSWRNNALLTQLGDFDGGLLPALRRRVAELVG